jgi:TATA-binding protein-associated factor Taf7
MTNFTMNADDNSLRFGDNDDSTAGNAGDDGDDVANEEDFSVSNNDEELAEQQQLSYEYATGETTEDAEDIADDKEEDEDSDCGDDKLDKDDPSEDNKDRVYVISIDNIPQYYEKDLKTARKKLWYIGNLLLKTSVKDDMFSENYILSNNRHALKIICPYDFFLLKYHHVLFDIRIDYVIKYNIKETKF